MANRIEKRERSKGTVYRAQITWTDRSGQRRTKSQSFRLRKDAQKWITAHEANLEQSDPTKMTFGEWVDLWLATREASGRAHSTLLADKSTLDLYAGALYRARLDSVLPTDIDNLITAMTHRTSRRGRNLSAGTIVRFRRTLRRCFADAHRKRLITSNPVDVAMPAPRQQTPKPKAWSRTETSAFFAWLSTAGRDGRQHHHYAALWLDVWSGLRHGELIALRWVDLDLDQGLLTVEQNRVLGVTKGPKSASGLRTIALDPPTVAVLRHHRDEQNQLRMRLGVLLGDGLVFLNTDTGPLGVQTLGQAFGRLIARAQADHVDIPTISLKDLRSTHGTLLATAGANARDIADRLGHADGGATAMRHYVSTSVDRERDLLNVLVGD